MMDTHDGYSDEALNLALCTVQLAHYNALFFLVYLSLYDVVTLNTQPAKPLQDSK
jgi:hypothetical protein